MLEIGRPVLLFTLCVSLSVPVLFGLVPALRAARTDLAATLKESGRSSGSVATLRGRRLLVATQMSLAITLMVVAGLIIRSLLDVRSLEYVYDPETVLTLRVELPEIEYPDLQDVRAFRQQVLERTEVLPGVVRAAWVDARPLADPVGTATVEIEGAELRSAEQVPWPSRPSRSGRTDRVGKGEYLGEFELLVMATLLRLGDEAYGMRIRRDIEERTGRPVPIGNVYAALRRLDAKGRARGRRRRSAAVAPSATFTSGQWAQPRSNVRATCFSRCCRIFPTCLAESAAFAPTGCLC